MSFVAPFVKPLQIAVNRYLDYDPEVPKQLAKMHGKVVELSFTRLELSLFIIITNDGLDIRDEFAETVDTKISGSPLALAVMSLQDASTDSLFSGDVVIEGDTELGTQFQEFMDNVEVDWEEPLSQITGDVVANQVGDFVRGMSGWLQETAKTNARNTSEYFREEKNMLPSKFEVERFKKEVDDLRLSTDRLEAKVQRLVKQREDARVVSEKEST
ncbi:MAG: sterol-binding protein [Cycloclasticus sp. symbiont of Bathymodiolus heckerae]|nr:MAG: sterol-binding protein [Cycloclasticus sp. symbiont of Bathymodiolus heckerae]